MADGSRHGLFYVAESTYGTTPTSPAMKTARHTSTSLALTKETFQSDEIRSDRQITDYRHGTKQVGGDIGVELSYGTFDDFLEALLGGTWATDTPVLGTDRLKAGTTRRSFSILRNFADLLTADKPFHLFTGCEINTLSLTVTASGIVTGSFGIIGKGLSTSGTAPSGTTFPAATTSKPLDGFSGSLNEAGSAIATITEIQLNIDNGLSTRFVVGSDETLRPHIGRSNVSGQITAYFENATLLDKFINETESNMDFTLTDAAGNDYKITIPRLVYNGGQPDVSGEEDILLTMPFQALLDSATSTNIMIDRTDA